MSLPDLYQRFLADPRSASLASDVSLVYIPTTTKLDSADAVRSHLAKQHTVVKTKAQNVLGVVEGTDALCLDIETTLEFVNGGGAYLPSLEDNFLTDRVVSFPTIHIVRFDANRHIHNVRIYWDQASLLRQVEVIGSRARTWPIRDANDQTRLIKSALAAKPADVGSAPPPTKQEEQAQEDQESRPVTPGKRRIQDPYAAGSLTDLLSPGDDRAEPVRAPRSAASAKPPPRDYEELFVGDDGDENEELDASPSKPRGSVMPKVGAGKNFQPNRLFDDDEKVAAEDPQPLAYRPHPNRFNHFDIGGDNSEREVQEKPAAGRTKSRHIAQWGFDDFVTPEKPRRQLRGQELHQFPWDDVTPQPTPTPRVPVAHPRRDAETHDEEPPKGGRMVSSFQNKHMSLYRDPLFDSTEDGEPEPPAQETRKARPHSLASNGTHRRKNFENHWDMSDSAVADAENQKPFPNSGKDRIKSVQMMEPHWEAYDESPKRPSVAPPRNGVRNAYHRSWDIGDGDA